MKPTHLTVLKKWRQQGMTYAECARSLAVTFNVSIPERTIARTLQKEAAKGRESPKGLVEEVVTPHPMERSDPTPCDNSRILCISDLHCPYQHPDIVAFLGALKAKYQPTRVMGGGDEIDNHAMSFYDSDPDLLSAGDELKAAIAALQPLYKLFPVMDLLDSNHGSLAYRKSKAHGISRKYLREYGDVLKAPPGWVWHSDLLIDLPTGQKCYFHHGIHKDIMKVVTNRGLCVVQFHFHTEFRIGYSGTPAALLWGLQCGCLIDRKSMAFAYDNNNLGRPVIGCGIILEGQPKLLPMVLDSNGRWNKFVP